MTDQTCPHQSTDLDVAPLQTETSARAEHQLASQTGQPPQPEPARPSGMVQRVWDWLLGRPVHGSRQVNVSQANPSQVNMPTSALNQETEQTARSRFVDVGWLVDTKSAEFIWEGPRPINRRLGKPDTPKAVQKCPAVLDFEKRFFVIPVPVDLHIGLKRDEKGKWVIVNKAGPQSSVYSNKVNELVHLTSADQWRHRDKPVIQISAPYRFVSDEPSAYLYQLPPFLHYGANAWPGTLIAGRLPAYVWPRILMWAMEWHDTEKDLILRRGEPWFFVHIETDDPTRPVRMVHAEMTDELRTYCAGTDGVTNYVNQTYSLFDTALARRPKTLLKPFDGALGTNAVSPD